MSRFANRRRFRSPSPLTGESWGGGGATGLDTRSLPSPPTLTLPRKGGREYEVRR